MTSLLSSSKLALRSSLNVAVRSSLVGAAVTGLVAASLAACTMAPRYKRPDAPVSATFPQRSGAGATADGAAPAGATPADATATQAAAASASESATPVSDIGWKTFFPDAQLQSLIERALKNNRDLRVAALNVEAAQATYRIQRAALVPTINAQAAGNSQRLPASVSQIQQDMLFRQYSATVGVTAFELDLFGRVRSLRRSALEQFLSLDETRQSAHLSLVSEVANAWLTLLADRELLKLTQETLQSQQSSFDLTKLRFNSGVASELDVRQAEIALRTAETNIATYSRRVEQDRNALTLLVGEPLAPQFDAGERAMAAQLLSQDLPAGLPAELLERRPDIRAAEHTLLARNADIGAARAAFFPRITLTGAYGQAHSDLDGLFDADHRTWSFAPQLTLPIFTGGANTANLDLSNVRKRIEIARYEKSIQSAFREVSDALIARRTLSEQLAAQEALATAASESFRLSDMRYRSGVESYLNTLIAQRDLYQAQQGVIGVRLAQASNTIALYKALGGGWKE